MVLPVTPSKPCGWICGPGLVCGPGLPCFHLGPRKVFGFAGLAVVTPQSEGAPSLICLLFIHRGLGVESKPELQRVLEHRRRNQLIRQKKEEEEAKKLQSPFEKELLKRHQRLDQVELSFQSSPGYPNQPARGTGSREDGWAEAQPKV